MNNKSGIDANVIAAVDINTVANLVYTHNFPQTILMCNQIQSLTANQLNTMNPDMILMSPPCQPFTRLGLQKDSQDKRSDALSHFINIVEELNENLKYVLLENVKGFETSNSRNQLIDCMKRAGFVFREFLLTPLQIGIPNCRLRYYLLAKRKPLNFSFGNENSVIENPINLPEYNKNSIEMYLEKILHNEMNYFIPDCILEKRVKLLDIVTTNSTKSCCFTKSYTHYAEGTGSVFTTLTESDINTAISSALLAESGERVEILKSLRLRYFTPREVANILCFPDYFQFPNSVTEKQKYRLLGNSINVFLVSQLIKTLCNDI